MKNNTVSKKEIITQIHDLTAKLCRRPKKRDSSYLNYYAKKEFGSWNKLMQAAGFKVRFYQKIKCITFDEKFSYFMGLLATDGHIVYDKTKGKYKVAIYTSYPEEKEILLKLIHSLFDYKAGVSSRMYGFNKKPNYEIRIASRNLVEALVNKFGLLPGAKSLNITVPKCILNSADSKVKGAFLRGVIDGDGSVLTKSIKIASGSKSFLSGIKKMLDDLSICSGKIAVDNKLTNTLSIRIGLIGARKLHDFMFPSEDAYSYPRKKILWKTNIFK